MNSFLKTIRFGFSRPIFLAVFCLAIFSGCTKKDQSTSSASKKKEVNLAVWSQYTSPEVLEKFEQKTGIKIRISNYSSNEELLAKLQAGASGYDVAVPSDYMVYAMIKLNLLNELDPAQIPNRKKLNPQFMKKSYDPESRFSVPYDWGTTGIAVNTAKFKGKLKGWKDLFENDELAGKFSFLDDVREVIGAALKTLGYSLNSRNPAELEKAKELLLKTRSRVKAFTSEPLMPLTNGEITVAHVFSSDALQARRNTNEKIQYILPEEGGTLSMDNFVIPKGAKNIAEAYELIDYFLGAEAGMATAKMIMVAPVNQEAVDLMPEVFRKNLGLFPTQEMLKKFEMIEDLGDALPIWDRIWTEVKASSH